MNPINHLTDKIVGINEKVADAQDIFKRKFQLIQDQVQTMLEKIDEDKQFQFEMNDLRKQEVAALQEEADRHFFRETRERKE